MKKRILSLLLALVMTASMLPAFSAAAGNYSAEPTTSDYFYNQLNDRAKAIYKKLLDEFTGTDTKAQYYDGKQVIDLIGVEYISGPNVNKPIISQTDINNYKNGNKDIFNDFCAAKDALDLDHSELWYIDSGYLTFRVTHSSEDPTLTTGYHVLIGPGRGETYLLGGLTAEEIYGTEGSIEAMDTKINATINDMVSKAVSALNAANTHSEADQLAYLATNIHDQITKGIHYRYEIECNKTEDAKFIRTIYGMQTHEGVCEAYARTLQVCLTRLGIQCVLVHGVQTKGTPEDHMWNAVNIPDTAADGHKTPRWYVIDATWDDPLTATYTGERDLKFNNGEDGKETNTYLLVGQSLVGEHWRPSGYVSTGNFEFKYPTIETAAYSGETIVDSDNGLQVKYSTGGATEGGTPAGVYTVTFKGWNAEQAAKHGFYFMLKMYDYHPDGTADVMDEWYYADASIALTGKNDYFGDYPEGLRFYTSTCEYVEVAVTSLQPYGYDTWQNKPEDNELSKNYKVGYFQGDESQIVAQSGMLYNVNSKYEAPPYVRTQFPAPNGNCTAGYDYRFDVVFDDDLKRPQADDPATADAFTDDTQLAAGQKVRVRYTTIQQDLHTGGEKYVQIAGELPFDQNRDGYVDMPGDDGVTTDKAALKWKYKYEGDENNCPNKAKHNNGKCDVNAGCAIIGVEFNFRASDQWIDDITEYNFSIEGVVGSRSNKFPNNFSVISCIPGLCPACYRSQGIDWNLWGQPTLLDAPENLDLYNMAKEGGTDKATLDKLNEEMNRDDLNGRLMLVVEDKSKGAGNREDYEKINDALPQDEKNAIAGADEVISSVFEINFNRICPMVKLKPNKNQSLRVQVGYPAGITYETLANYDLKAYHFTRCSNDPDYYCPEVKAALEKASANEKADILKNHKWGEHIISTEQIEIVPTPYGMVIMCSAFSPFEIVAVKKSDTAASAIAEAAHNVVVVSGENGKVKIGDNYAVGANGNQKIPNGGSLTFTVEPASGYVVDTVSFGGTTVQATGNNTYKLENITKSDVLNVTFIPGDVKTAEVNAYGETLVASVCTHPHLEYDKNDPKENATADCTHPGYQKAQVCTTCGQTVVPAKVIPAKGHTPATKEDGASYYKEGKPASCTDGGINAYVKCTKCEVILSDGKETSPLGHIFTNYTEGARDCRGVTLTATCDRDGCNVVDTKVNPDGRVDHKYTKYTVTTPATCTANAIETASCDFGCGSKATREVQNTATGHTPKDDGSGLCKDCNTYICSDSHKWIKTDAVEPDCTTPGHTAGEKCEICGVWKVEEKIVPALGHEFNDHKAGTKCNNCDVRLLSDNHTPEEIPEIKPTCDTQGSKGGTRCSQCGQIIKQPEIVEALGHKWNTTDITWNWSTEGTVSASVTLTCTNDPTHKETIAATVEQTNVTKNATCTATGTATYTATATLPDNKIVTETKADVVVPMTKHAPGDNSVETTLATCAHHGTRTYTCSVCNQEIVETIEGDLPAHEFIAEPTKSTAPTCTQAGKNVSICAVCHEEQEEVVPALGHNYVNGVCTRCGATNTSYTAPTVPSGSTGGSRTETVTGSDGSKTTTVTASDGSKTTTTTTADGVVGTTKTDADGNVTSVDVIMPYGSETGEAVVAPVKVKASVSSEDTPEIGITVREGSARVEIPVENVNHGTVAVIVDEDGNETVIRDCAVDENGVIITVDGSVTVKIVDRSVDFTDVQTTGHWASDAVEFVAARSLFNGTGEGVFSPETAMERGMLVTVLHRLAYEPEADSTQITFGDIQSNDYFAEASAWANANHIVEGYNGSFHPRDDVSREDLVTILYRYAKFKGYATETSGNALTSFTDVQNVKSYAVEAMNWAVSVGLVNGVTADRLAPQAGAKRAEVATIIERFCKNVVK